VKTRRNRAGIDDEVLGLLMDHCFDTAKALEQGWLIGYRDYDGTFAIERDDDSGIFPDDDKAREWVVARAIGCQDANCALGVALVAAIEGRDDVEDDL
jgi:hypothetical protein